MILCYLESVGFELGLILHYIPCFRAIIEGSGETAQMFSLARESVGFELIT